MTRIMLAARAATLATVLLAGQPAVWAQTATAPADAAKLEDLEAQLRTLTAEAGERQAQLDALQKEVGERDARISTLTAQAADAAAQAKTAQDRLAEATAQAKAAEDRLAEATAQATAVQSRLTEAEVALAERNGVLDRQRADLLAARNDLASAEARLGGKDKEVAALATAGRELVAASDEATKLLAERDAQVAELRAQLLAARNDLASAEARLGGKDKEVAALATAGRELVATGDEATKLLAERDAQVGELRAELLAARNDLGSTEAKLLGKDKEIAALVAVARELVAGGSQLEAANETLEQELAALTGPEEAFLGGLQEALGPETGVRMEADRLIFPSDVAFVSGSAKLTPAAREKALELGRAIATATAALPADGDWVLRIDGHTDRQAVGGRLFASNRELSAARALEVVDVLTEAGVPAERLVPAAFGEFRPLDPADTPEAYRANRRIELQFDEG